MYSYLFDSTKTQHPATHLDIHTFLRITNIKNVVSFIFSSHTPSHNIKKNGKKRR